MQVHGASIVAKATTRKVPLLRSEEVATATLRPHMAAYVSQEELEWGSARMAEAVQRWGGGSADAFGRLLGYANGGFIREVISKKKPIGKAIRHRVREHMPELESYLDYEASKRQRSSDADIITNDDKGNPSVDHAMSLTVHTVPHTLKWEDLMTVEKLPGAFRLVMRDNAMAPVAGAGATVEFIAAKEGQVGDAVLVRDAQGRYHFREMCELADGWEARPTNPAFARLNSREHGLTVVAVFSGVARVGSWSDLTR